MTTTAEEFAEAHGLSVEEAALILSRRGQASQTAGEAARVTLARIALQQAHRKTGVAPVVVTPSGLEKSEVLDPEAEARFYASKLGQVQPVPSPKKPSRWVPAEDVSQDPGDYEP